MAEDAWLWGTGAAILAALAMQAFVSHLETALLSARRSRLTHLGERDPARLRRAEELLDDPPAYQTAAHVTATVCEAVTYAAVALLSLGLVAKGEPGTSAAPEALFLHALPWMAAALAIAVLVVLLLGEALPKTLATRAPERVLLRYAGFMRAYSLALSPVLFVIRWIGSAISRALRIQPDPGSRAARTEEEIKIITGASAEEGVIEEEEKEMIHSIFEFTETSAAIMSAPDRDARHRSRRAAGGGSGRDPG